MKSEYGISKSTINGWIKNSMPVAIDEGKVVTMKEYKALKQEMDRIKEENETIKKPWPYWRKSEIKGL